MWSLCKYPLHCTHPSCDALVEPIHKRDGSHPHFLSMLPEQRQITYVFVFERVGVLCSVGHALLSHMPLSVAT